MVKIRISYEKPEELTEVLRRLHPVGNIRQHDKGRYKKAYIDMKLMNTIRAREMAYTAVSHALFYALRVSAGE